VPSRAKVRARWNEKYGPREPGADSKFLAMITDTEFYQRDVLPRLEKGLLDAGTRVVANFSPVHTAVDFGVLGARLYKWASGQEPLPDSVDIPWTSDALQKRLGGAEKRNIGNRIHERRLSAGLYLAAIKCNGIG